MRRVAMFVAMVSVLGAVGLAYGQARTPYGKCMTVWK